MGDRAPLSEWLGSLGADDYDEKLRQEASQQRPDNLQVLGFDAQRFGVGSTGTIRELNTLGGARERWTAPGRQRSGLPRQQLGFGTTGTSGILRAFNTDGSDMEESSWDPLFPTSGSRKSPPSGSGARKQTLATLKALELREAIESDGKAATRSRMLRTQHGSPLGQTQPAAVVASPPQSSPSSESASHNALIRAVRAENHAEIWRLATEQPQLSSTPDSDGWSAMHWASVQLAHAQARNSGGENERLRKELSRERAENARLAEELRAKDAALGDLRARLAASQPKPVPEPVEEG